MMQNEHLSQLLKELPRYEASDHFTDSVIRAAGRTERPKALATVRNVIVASAAVIILGVGTTTFIMHQREQIRVEAIAEQHRELEREIAALREETAFDPVIDIGQDDGVRYILDLRPVEVQPVRTAALQPTFD